MMGMPARPMPAALRLVLTNPWTCGLLLALMFSAQLWLPWLGKGSLWILPLLLLCMMLNFLVPAVAALVSLGGGLLFALQAGLVAMVLIYLVPGSGMALLALFALGYVLVPAVAARGLLDAGGVDRASDLLMISAAVGSLVGLLLLAQQHAGGAHAWVLQAIEPLLDQMAQRPNGAPPPDVRQGLLALFGWSLPGMIAVSIWSMWGISLGIARVLAQRYGFYQGDPRSVLWLRPSAWCAWVFLAALALANFAGGDAQYIGVTLALLFGSLMAFNGVAVAHLWLRGKGMLPLIVLMYVMIVFWTMVIFPFVILGLMDIWQDFRRSIRIPDNDE